MNYFFLTKTMLFRGTSAADAESMLKCLGGFTRIFEKGEVIYRAGNTVEHIGMVLSGSVNITTDDIWGNVSIFSHVGTGEIFAETYASIPGTTLLVNVTASEKAKILFLNVAKMMSVCSNSCPYHNQLIQNLLQISARKNLELSKRMLHTSPKSIRGRLVSYFSEQITQNGNCRFSIPFNRQQLADYLNVDRSAMSNELSKMRKEGILTYEKNFFSVNTVNKNKRTLF